MYLHLMTSLKCLRGSKEIKIKKVIRSKVYLLNSKAVVAVLKRFAKFQRKTPAVEYFMRELKAKVKTLLK